MNMLALQLRRVARSVCCMKRGRLAPRSDRAGCDTDPGAVTLLVHVRVQSFLLRSIGEHGVCGAAVDESNVTEDADVDVVHGQILEGPRLGDVVEELGTVAGDTRKLRDEVFGEELAEALDIVELVGVEEVFVELLENRQIGGLVRVVHFLVPSPCGSAFAAGGLSFQCVSRLGRPPLGADQPTLATARPGTVPSRRPIRGHTDVTSGRGRSPGEVELWPYGSA